MSIRVFIPSCPVRASVKDDCWVNRDGNRLESPLFDVGTIRFGGSVHVVTGERVPLRCQKSRVDGGNLLRGLLMFTSLTSFISTHCVSPLNHMAIVSRLNCLSRSFTDWTPIGMLEKVERAEGKAYPSRPRKWRMPYRGWCSPIHLPRGERRKINIDTNMSSVVFAYRFSMSVNN